MKIHDFQLLIERLYLEKDRTRGVSRTFLWFTEEVGELAEALPPAIRWERTKTLGRGNDVFDFRWSLVAPE